VCSTCESNTATQSVPRSPSPASAETLSGAHKSAGHRHPPAIPTAAAHTSAARRWPTPPSPCSANNQSAAQSPRSRPPPTCEAVGSQPSPPRSTPASSLARLRPESRGSWSIFSCRTVVSIQLPSTEGSKRPAVGQAAGTDVRFTITGDCCGQPLLGSARRGRVHAPELGDPGAFRLEVIKGCWAQDRTGGRTSFEKVRSTHDSDEFARRPWSVLT
jgi:hypothetical protein